MLLIYNKYILTKERPADLIESVGFRDTTHNIIINGKWWTCLTDHTIYLAHSFEFQNPLLGWPFGIFAELLQEYYDLGNEPG